MGLITPAIGREGVENTTRWGEYPQRAHIVLERGLVALPPAATGAAAVPAPIPLRFLFGLVDPNGPAIDILTIQRPNDVLYAITLNRHKAKPT